MECDIVSQVAMVSWNWTWICPNQQQWQWTLCEVHLHVEHWFHAFPLYRELLYYCPCTVHAHECIASMDSTTFTFCVLSPIEKCVKNWPTHAWCVWKITSKYLASMAQVFAEVEKWSAMGMLGYWQLFFLHAIYL